MRLLIVFVLVINSTALFAQPEKPVGTIADLEKKGRVNQVLGDGVSFTLASLNFTTYYARFHWNIDPNVYYISGWVTYYVHLTQQADSISFDLDDSLIVDSVSFQGMNTSFKQSKNKTVSIFFPQTISAEHKDSLSIFYHGMPASSGFGSFTQSMHNGNVPVIWTLSEPYGARDWYPCRNGLDDKIDSMDIYITHPSQYTASANGLLTDTSTNNNYTTSHFQHRYPIATYLVGIAVTNYVTFSQQVALQNGTLPVTTTVYPEYVSYFQTYVPSAYNALQLYDKYFGTYPFIKERYGQTEFGWSGGMEHQSNSFIHNADEYLMAHELAHQWFGDKITLGSWQDIWLNEGFAVYLADIFYTEHFHPENLANIVSQSVDYATNEPDGSVWVDDTTNVNRIFSFDLSYKKAAMLLRMLRWRLGDSVFFKGIRQYQSDSSLQYNFARTKDLQRNLETASDKSLTDFFNQWFYGKGFPSFAVQWNWSKNKLQLQINETTSNASVPCFYTPLQLRFANASQQQDTVINISKNVTQLLLPLNFKPDTVLIDPSQYIISKNNTSIEVNEVVLFNDNDQIILYPNPGKNMLYIHLPLADSITSETVIVTSASGAIVYKKKFGNIYQNTIALPVARLSKGVYFVVLQSNKNKTVTKKFIRQ